MIINPPPLALHLMSSTYRATLPKECGRNNGQASELVRRIERQLGARDAVVSGDYDGTFLTFTVRTFKGQGTDPVTMNRVIRECLDAVFGPLIG